MEEYYRDKDNEVYSIIRSSLREEVPRKSVANQKILTVTWDLKFKRRPEWTIRYLKISCFVRRDDQKRMSTEPLNCYYTMFQWEKLRLILNLQWIIGLQSQSINFTNAFAQGDIPTWERVFIEHPRYFKR